MPEQMTAEQYAEVRADLRGTVTGAVVTYANDRHAVAEPGRVRVAARAIMSPNATRSERVAHMHAILRDAELIGADGTPDVRPVVGLRLTPHRLAMVECGLRGMTYVESAHHLSMAVSTAKKHAGNAYRDLGVNSMPEAVIAAIRCGLLPYPSELLPEGGPTTATARKVPCATEGCRKRTAHASGLCPDHREAE